MTFLCRIARSIRAAAAVLAAATAITAAPAGATVLYQYQSTCLVFCSRIGLDAGDAVGGLIGFSDDAIALGVALSAADVESLDLTFGNQHFDLSALGFAFAIFTGPDAESFVFALTANAIAPTFGISEVAWSAGAGLRQLAFGGQGTLTRVVPEPGTLALAALAAVAALGLRRRRRR
jgi:hypothetical protein